jgi:hypothetical protein
VAFAAKAIAIASSPQKFPQDLDAIADALADTPAEAERMRVDREAQAAMDAARQSRGPHDGGDIDMTGW